MMQEVQAQMEQLRKKKEANLEALRQKHDAKL